MDFVLCMDFAQELEGENEVIVGKMSSAECLLPED